MGEGALRLQIRRVSLVGTSRTVEFEPGLNVILSSTTTGKTSLMRLLRVLLGSDYDGIIPELRRVSDVSGSIVLEENQVAVVRRLAQTDNAPVDVATDDQALRLPAMRSDREDLSTYGDWLIEQLGLPHLRVPTAPSRPAESATTPVSISDYLRYCRITQEQIDVDVLGSSNFFTDYKRRIAFRIYFGSYDVRVAELQEELRGSRQSSGQSPPAAVPSTSSSREPPCRIEPRSKRNSTGRRPASRRWWRNVVVFRSPHAAPRPPCGRLSDFANSTGI
jgi:hypothetical protein